MKGGYDRIEENKVFIEKNGKMLNYQMLDNNIEKIIDSM
jgi:hypothetical protein